MVVPEAPSEQPFSAPPRSLSDAAPEWVWHVAAWLRGPAPYRMAIGYALALGAWYTCVDGLALPRFEDLPGVGEVFREWTSRAPSFGLSLYTPVYYEHILTSLRRVGLAFALATSLGVPVGLLLGASPRFRDYVFPVLELLRPIPILAWVPLAIIIFDGSESPVVFLTFLASFFATALNAQLGVRSIDAEYLLAARCLGAGRAAVFWHVILPGALPSIFTGLEVSVGVAWFSLVAAEMVSGQFGLGYVINTSFTMVQYPTIIIGMLTLGVVGHATSAAVRLTGRLLMGWRARALRLEAA
jgi:NitT/TauT family transport system permease protein